MIFELSGFADPVIAIALAFWSGHVTGYQDAAAARTIEVRMVADDIDGEGGTFATTKITTEKRGSRWYAKSAEIVFDQDDWKKFGTVRRWFTALHELGHALGLGALWELNGLKNSDGYIGPRGLATYNAEFNQSSVAIPLEGNHWRELHGGWDKTGIRDSYGRDLRDEAFTTYSYVGDPYVSATTLRSLEDLGFVVRMDASVLELFVDDSAPGGVSVEASGWDGMPRMESSADLRSWAHGRRPEARFFRLVNL